MKFVSFNRFIVTIDINIGTLLNETCENRFGMGRKHVTVTVL